MTEKKSNINMSWLHGVFLPLLATGMMYIMGWAYADHYFNQYQLKLLSIDIPHQYFVVYGFWVLIDNIWWLIALYLGLIGVVTYFSSESGSVYMPYVHLLMPLLAFSIFIGAYTLAYSTAKQAYHNGQQQDYPSYPSIKAWFKAEPTLHPTLQALASDLPQGCYRLLLQSNGRIWVFKPSKTDLSKHLVVTEISLKDLSALQVLPQYDSCD